MTSSFLLIRLVFVPLLQWMRIGKVISYDAAARIIGEHFIEIQDKLLNTLQLISRQKSTSENTDLLLASIDQKISALRVFRFTNVINLKKNLRYLKYALPPVLIILLFVAFSPKMISEPAGRIIKFNQTFEPPPAFSIEILNRNLKAMQQDDFEVNVKLIGEEIPAEVFIRTGDVTYKMKKSNASQYSHLFRSLQANVRFKVIAADVTSKEFEITVFPKPILLNFEMQLDYPGYLKRSSDVIENAGDCIVPEGTQITWHLFTKDVSSVLLHFNNEKVSIDQGENNRFTVTRRIFQSTEYSISPLNKYTYRSDSLNFRITVIPDGYPSISITETLDSLLASNIFFKGIIKDDYGFTKLVFNAGIIKEGDTARNEMSRQIIPIDESVNNQVFYFAYDLSAIALLPGDNLTYYFEIWDNDGIHGPKSAKSEVKYFKVPSLKTISENLDKTEKKIQEDIENSILENRTIKNSIDDLNRKMVDQKSVTWQEKKKMEEILKSSEKILDRMEEIKKANLENIGNEEKYLETSERILEKQKQLNELMEQLLTPEMKKILEEMKELLNQVDKNRMNELLEKMKMNNKELETQLDRNLELFKQLEFDRQLEQKVNEIRKLAQEQKELTKESEEKKSKENELLGDQEKLIRKFDSIRKSLTELNEKGKKLENPIDLTKTEAQQDSISKAMNESKTNLEDGKRKESIKKQKEASEKMEQLANSIEKSQSDNEEEELAEDAASIRMILENLIRLSFNQEELIKLFKTVNRNDPGLVKLINRQNSIKDQMKGVEDSLNAVARRQVIIKPIISRELLNINMNMNQTLEAIANRNLQVAAARQQYTMTGLNNLAILLNESLKKMNDQMSMSMNSSGKKACKKPSGKGGKMSAKSIKDLQQKLGLQLGKMKDGMEKMKNQGSGSKSDQSAMSKELSRLAAQQEAIRNELNQYQKGLMEEGVKDGGNMNKTMSEMEMIEKDIINKRINQETISRQQSIVTRLLESEKAEQVHEREEKRESVEAKSYQKSNPNSNFKYNIDKRGNREAIEYVQPSLNRFYRNKVNNYMIKIER